MARIGVDAHVLDGKYQGSRTWLDETLMALAKIASGHQWVIYSARPERTRLLYQTEAFEHRRIGMRGSVGRQLWFSLHAVRRDDLDALLTQYIAPPLRIPSFVVIHDLLFESQPEFFPLVMRWRLRLLCRNSARRAAAVFTVSEYSAKEIVRRYGVPPERIFLAPNGYARPSPVNPEVEAQVLPLRPFLLCVGRLEPRKNVTLALQASAVARAAGVRLVVVGKADFQAAALVATLRQAENVIHLQDVSRKLLSSLYRNASALVYPSLGEGFGIPVVDALAHGTPVLASNRTAIPEVGGGLASYFDPLSNDAIGELRRLIERVLSEESRPPPDSVARHLSRFEWSASAAALIRAANSLNVVRPSAP